MYAVYYVDMQWRRTLIGKRATLVAANRLRDRHAARFGLAAHWYDVEKI